MKKLVTALAGASILAGLATVAMAADVLVLKDFEGKFVINERAVRLVGSDKDYAGAYSGPNSESVIEVVKEKGAKDSQALKINFNKSDWAGVGFDFNSAFTADYKKFRIMYKGLGSGYKWRIQFTDAGNEQHEFVMEDDTTSWKTVEFNMSDAQVRTDWQPDDKDGNETLNYPLKSANIESYDTGECELFIDQFEAVK